MLTPETRLEHWLAAIRDALGGGGGGSGTQTYTVSGEGETPVALPEGLSIPTTMTEGFTGAVAFTGYGDKGGDIHGYSGELPLTFLEVQSDGIVVVFQQDADPQVGDPSMEFGFLVNDGIIEALGGSVGETQIIIDNDDYPFTYTITFTDAR